MIPRIMGGLVVALAVASCGGVGAPLAISSPRSAVATTPAQTSDPSPVPVLPPSLMCPGHYQAGHPLVTALTHSQAGYDSLAVLDVAEPLAPSLVCTINHSPYPLQPIQWLSPSEFALLFDGQPARLVSVDVGHRSITAIRDVNGEARLSRDRAWLVTMEAGTGGTRAVRLYGPAGDRTLATYPPALGHGGTIYGFGGPTIGFSPDGSLVLAVDSEANYADPTVPDLRVFDLQGSLVLSVARGLWAVWLNAALYYSGGDGNVYRWVRGTSPVAIMQSDWFEPTVSPDGQSIAYLTNPGYAYKLNVLNTRSGIATTLQTSGPRIYPLFVDSSLIWSGELQTCDNCYGGTNSTGNVFAYDLSTGSEHEVNLPVLLNPLAGASLSSGP